ncbi:hypothetical protein SK128_025073 [Halocaridina rubra]|uniref:Uncharacterized protein n=1 Tax=Halocaridina rubra TaxID=373956 RepID=A0AAN8WSV3_HALRR
MLKNIILPSQESWAALTITKYQDNGTLSYPNLPRLTSSNYWPLFNPGKISKCRM